MKTTFFAALLLLGLSSCENTTVRTGSGAEKTISGNGNVTIVNREIPGFSRIDCEGLFNIILDQGPVEALRVETDENLQQIVSSEVKDDVLLLRMKDSSDIGKISRMNIHVTVRELEKLKTAGLGNICCLNTLHLKHIEIECTGVGLTSLDLDAERISIDARMVGALKLKGRAGSLEIEHKGIGAIEAFGLEARDVRLQTSGVGGADVFASNSLEVESKGIGKVRYKGHPAEKKISSQGIGKIEELN